MNRWAVAAGALGVGVGAVYLEQSRPKSGAPAHAGVSPTVSRGTLGAAIATRWPQMKPPSAVGAAAALFVAWKAQYGTHRSMSGSDVAMVPIGVLAAEAAWWSVQATATRGRAWPEAAKYLTSSIAAGAGQVDLEAVLQFRRELTELAIELDEKFDLVTGGDNRGYLDFFGERWGNATDAIAGVGATLAGGVGKVVGGLAGGIFGSIGQWLVIGGVAYWAWRRWEPAPP